MIMTRLGLGVLLTMLFIAGCSTPTNLQNAADSNGLSLTWDWNDGKRTVLPESYPTPVAFDVELTASGQSPVQKKGLTEKSWSINHLPAALWSITVKGYDASGNLLVVGGDTIDLSLKSTHSLSLVLYYQSSGTGKYHLKLTSTVDLGTEGIFDFILTNPAGTVVKSQKAFLSDGVELASEVAEAGTYKLFVKLSSPLQTAIKMESLIVFQGVDTVATLVFGESDFSTNYIPVKEIQFAGDVSLSLGEDRYLQATVLPANASQPVVSWKSSNPQVVSVTSQDGHIQALAFGTATITATSVDGGVTGSLSVSVLPDNTTATLQKAKDLFKDKKYTEALATFEKSNNGEATAYKSLLKLAHLGVHPDVIDAAKNLLGLKDYPATMEELFSSGWFKGEFFTRTWAEDYYPAVRLPGSTTTIASYYVSYYQYAKQTLPSLDVPPEIRALFSSVYSDAGKAPGATTDQFFVSVLFNALTKDPQGLNALLDRLDTGVFGSGWDEVLTSIAALPDDEVITLDYQQTPGLPSWIPFNTSQMKQTVVVGKAELLAEAATLELLRSVFQWIKAQNLAFPSQSVVQTLDFKTGKFTGPIQGKNPLQASFLSLRDPSSLVRSKASLAEGFGKLKQAIDLVRVRTSESAYDLKPSILGAQADSLDKISVLLGQVQSAVLDGTSLYVPSDPFGLLSGKDDLVTPGAQKTQVNLAALFDLENPLIQLPELVVLNAEKSAPLWYVQSSVNGNPMVEVGPGLATPIAMRNALNIKVLLTKPLGKLLPTVSLPPSLDTYLPVSLLSQGDKIMAWFGQTWTPPVEVTVGGS